MDGKRLEALLDGVAAKIRPTKEDLLEIGRNMEFVVGRLSRVVPPDVEIGMAGSVAKGTNLSSNRELDVFLLIPRKLTHEQMTKRGLGWAKRAMKGEKTEIGYANHPYLKVRRGGCKIDIVPSYKIENAENLGSAVDRSQLHTKYINGRMDAAQKDGVRLLKQFCKTLGVYGAELKVEGFSGYLCELLVLHYGSFEGVLHAASKWGERPVLDFALHHPKTDLRKMFDAPLIVVDPVDPKRNVAAVVSRTSLSRFILASRQFLKNPSDSFFFHEKEVHSAGRLRAMMRMRDTSTLALFFTPPKLVEDILWPQMRKSALALVRELEKADFRVFGHYFWADEGRALMLFETMEGRLPGVRRRAGPAIWYSKDVQSFIEKHSGAVNLHLEHDKIIAVEKRQLLTPPDVVKAALAKGDALGMPKGFRLALKKAEFGNALQLLKKPYLEVASDYFSRRI